MRFCESSPITINRFIYHMSPLKRLILILVVLTLFLLFFIGGPGYHSQRSYKNLWNMGHILFFLLLPLTFTYNKHVSKNAPLQYLLVLSLPVLLGVLIEIMQYGLQRIPDTSDLFRNMIGGVACIFFILPLRKKMSKTIRLMGQIGIIILTGFQVYPVIISFADEHVARKQFPELSGFETPFEITRWSGGADFNIDKSLKRAGRASIRVHFKTDKYSGIGLNYFPNNWEGYGYFQFTVYNPSSESISLTCRIHDMKHTENGQRYEDRFNRTFSISPGWQTLTVSLEDIERAPKGRRMNMQEIRNVHFFTISIPHRRVVYLDDLKLTPPS